MPDNLALRQEVRRFLERPGPGVCDVRVIPDEVRAPRISSRQQEDGTFISHPWRICGRFSQEKSSRQTCS